MADTTKSLEYLDEAVEPIECFEPIEALEDWEGSYFTRCWDCDEIINSKRFPVCDDCVIRHGPARRWCCETEDGHIPAGIMGFQMSAYCQWNLAYWGRWETVFHRRALVA